MPKQHRFQVEDLSRLLLYALGHRPDEFGLVPDEDGFVPVKRLLQALREEPGWSHVREGLLREVLVHERERFETDGSRIRARERRFQVDTTRPVPPPAGLLFSPVRKRAHSHALEHGLEKRPDGPHILTTDRETALRIGRRTDPSPVLLELHIPSRGAVAVPLYPFGDLLLAWEVPAEAVVGPPLSKEQQKALDKPPKTDRKGKREAERHDFEAGPFALDPERDPDPSRRGSKGRKKRTWKEKARKLRREP
jgi:putative RNA 2'-phosphotransferase